MDFFLIVSICFFFVSARNCMYPHVAVTLLIHNHARFVLALDVFLYVDHVDYDDDEI